MFDSRCMVDCYPPAAVGEEGEGSLDYFQSPEWVLLFILSSIIYSIICSIIGSNLPSQVII